MTESKPSVGRIVHYVSYGTPGGEYGKECRAAIVTEVGSGLLTEATEPLRDLNSDDVVVGLCVLNPWGQFFNRAAYHVGAGNPGSPDCFYREQHGEVHRYCACGFTESALRGGTWHWPEHS